MTAIQLVAGLGNPGAKYEQTRHNAGFWFVDAVASLAAFYRIARSCILVVHDDLDLPPGTVRLKRGGGHGGHNGLRDLIPKLGGNDFLRLRIGIGHPGHRDDVVGYVLKPAPHDEQAAIDAAIDAALGVLPDIVAGRLDKAMKELHTTK